MQLKSIIFIVGSSRSGTTMMNRILDNNREILGLNELHYFGKEWDPGVPPDELNQLESIKISSKLLATAKRGIWGHQPDDRDVAQAKLLISQAERIDYKNLYTEVLCSLAEDAGKTIVVDQTPRNILYAADILANYPNAVILHMVRDPRAVLLSQRNRWRRRSKGSNEIPWWNRLRVFFNYHPITTTHLWLMACQKGIEVEENSRYMRVRFEDFIESPEQILKQICSFLKVDYDQKMQAIPRIGSSNLQNDANKSGISIDVIDVWKTSLPKSDLWICQFISSSFMSGLGYTLVNISFPVLKMIPTILRYPLHVTGILMTNPGIALKIVKKMDFRNH